MLFLFVGCLHIPEIQSRFFNLIPENTHRTPLSLDLEWMWIDDGSVGVVVVVDGCLLDETRPLELSHGREKKLGDRWDGWMDGPVGKKQVEIREIERSLLYRGFLAFTQRGGVF